MAPEELTYPWREELPTKRRVVREKIAVGGLTIYVAVGFYPDGRPGEVFLTAAKKGAVLRELLDGFSIVLSTALQHGLPLSVYSVKSEDSELTGKVNPMLKAIFSKLEELCAVT